MKKKNMIKLVLDENRFQINDVDFEFPVNVYALRNLLGEFRQTVKEFNTIYTWDEYGILAYSKNGTWIESILLSITNKGFDFSPNEIFKGQFLINEQEVFSFYKNNKDKIFKRFSGDSGGAFAINSISVSFNKKEQSDIFDSIQINAYETKEKPETLIVDMEYEYFIDLWKEWIEETTKIVPEDNPYYNLTHGITQKQLDEYKLLDVDDNIKIPDMLINFYKIHNVKYDGVTSPFSFCINNWHYDLLPFEKIKRDWDNIQFMHDDDNDISDLVSEYDEKVKADNYANPNWIPFAEGRNGDYLLFDTDPNQKGKYGQIIELQNESWYRGVIADSLEELLQNEIKVIKNGTIEKFDFIIGKE